MSARSRTITGYVVGFVVGGMVAFLLEMWWDDINWQHAVVFAIFVMGLSTISHAVFAVWHTKKSHRAAGI